MTSSDEHIGKTVLVGLTFVATDGPERHEQVAGRVTGLDIADRETPLVILDCDDGIARTYPWSELAVSVAPPGEYKLAQSQKVYADPDFLMQFSIYPNPES